MNNKKKWGLIFAICFSGFGTYSDNIIIPLLTRIYEEFPDTSLFLQNYIISGSAAASLAAALLSGFLMKRFSKKTLLITGTILFIFGGTAGFFTKDILFLAVTRTIDAISDGLLLSVSNSLIIELFTDEAQRGRVFGWSNASSCIYGIFASFLSGVIALYSWKSAFLINLISVATLILILRFVPFRPPASDSGEKKSAPAVSGISRHYRLHAILNLLLMFLMGACGSQIYLMIDLYLSENKIGNSVLSGMLTAVSTLVSVLACVVFPRIYTLVSKYTLTFLLGVSGLSLTGFAVWRSVPLLIIAAAAAGFAIGASLVYYPLHIGSIVPAGTSEFYMSLVTADQYFYMIIGPYLPSFIGTFTGSTSITTSFFYSGVLLLLLGAISFLTISVLRVKKKINGPR
ncbi:MAG TPA: MFS transporter [Candidatus Scatomonas pullistercoris]|uniref:MFS transporter n=1 Tax=Candidatus Scatomonas pullistercoris TaxID=2840920 RepID=A0A9D1TAZ5_9FIRM|nr:MFS transporter [Candidatus Scatomonas pullistercoris]